MRYIELRSVMRLANILYAIGWRGDFRLSDIAWASAATLAGVPAPDNIMKELITVLVSDRAMVDRAFKNGH